MAQFKASPWSKQIGRSPSPSAPSLGSAGKTTGGGAFKITGSGPQGNQRRESTSPSPFDGTWGLGPRPGGSSIDEVNANTPIVSSAPPGSIVGSYGQRGTTYLDPKTGALVGFKPPRPSIQNRGGGGGGGGGGGTYIPPIPIEFNLGTPPEQKPLELPLEEVQKRIAMVNQPQQLAAMAEQYNAPTRQAFESYLPQFKPSLAAMGNLAYDYLGGRVPTSVAQDIGRSAAAANLQTGLFGGGLGRKLVARDLGLQSLNLQQTGADLLGRSFGLAQQAMQVTSPISVANLMINPQQIYQDLMSQAQYNQQIAYQNLLNAFQSQALPGQYVLGKGFQTYTPGVYSATRPLTPDEQAQISANNARLSRQQRRYV